MTEEQAAFSISRPAMRGSGEILPKQFGKYTLLSRLSAGGMAEIFLALHRSMVGFEKLVVIKRILPKISQDRTFVDMLIHEARVAATLSHPNIVQTFDAGEIDGKYFIAMEHIHGEDILEILRKTAARGRPTMPMAHALGTLIGVCAALSYMHEKRDLAGAPLGIVHRDISPRNIVVGFEGDVKIVDFGVAQSELEEVEPPIDPKSRSIKGKVAYMSPEQALGEEIDWRTDLFAAGIVLFELTTGKAFSQGSNQAAMLLMICDSEYPRPTEITPGYPPALERIVMRALQKKREDRYQSAREMQADLEQFVRDEHILVSTADFGAWMKSLFEEKLARHKEVLLGVKELVSAVAAQQKSWSLDGSSHSGSALPAQATVAGNISPSARSLSPPAKASLGMSVIPVVSALALVGGFIYMHHEMSRREAEILKIYRDEQALRPPSIAPTNGKGALEISSKPDGCAIWLDGDLRPEVTPAKLDRLPLGREIHIKLTKAGLAAYRTSVRLTEDAPFKEVEAEMMSTGVTVVLHVDPPASVWVDGQPWNGDRSRIEGLTPSDPHQILMMADGYASKTVTVSADAGETKTLTVQLARSDDSPTHGDAP